MFVFNVITFKHQKLKGLNRKYISKIVIGEIVLTLISRIIVSSLLIIFPNNHKQWYEKTMYPSADKGFQR